MRVVAGEQRGIPLRTLKGNDTRPTSDKVKESLFNRIGPYLDGGIAVDLFAGSGSLGIEALSRGAEHAYFFEKERKALPIIQQNLEKCRLTDRATVIGQRAERSVAHLLREGIRVSYLFVDPPYELKEMYELPARFEEEGLLADDALIICEHDRQTKLPERYGRFTVENCSNYGSISVTIYS